MFNKKVGEFIFNLLTYIFFIFLVIVAFYFVISDGFDTFRKILIIVSPVALFLLPTFFGLKKWFQLDDGHKNYDFTLFLTQGDRIIMDILMYGVAAAIMFLAALNQDVDLTDLLQALLALLAILAFKAFLFKRAKV